MKREKKIHWIDDGRGGLRLWVSYCGLYSSSMRLPHLMTFSKSTVTCKNCLRGSRKEDKL